jgi:hypothetical protein
MLQMSLELVPLRLSAGRLQPVPRSRAELACSSAGLRLRVIAHTSLRCPPAATWPGDASGGEPAATGGSSPSARAHVEASAAVGDAPVGRPLLQSRQGRAPGDVGRAVLGAHAAL